MREKRRNDGWRFEKDFFKILNTFEKINFQLIRLLPSLETLVSTLGENKEDVMKLIKEQI